MRKQKTNVDVFRTLSRGGARLTGTLLLATTLVIRIIYSPNRCLLNIYYVSHSTNEQDR